MKVLQILPELNIGGVERGTVDLARELINRGHQALVISNGGRLVEQLEAQGARHIKLSVHKKSLFSILANIPRVAKILRQEKVDIVHARSRVPALIAFLACRGISGVSFVTTCHGYYSQNFFSRVMGWGKLVIVSSSVMAEHMSEDFNVPPERIRLVPRGVDLGEFKFNRPSSLSPHPSAIFTIGVIGRLTPIKGHKYFLQALARVIRVLPAARALIVGDISPGKDKYKEELLMLTRRLSLNGYVQFLGRADNIEQVLSRLDVLVLPTVTQEAFGRVLIEAGACGVPVIATRVGGVIDIIQDGVNGILVEPGDPIDLASSLIKLCQQPQLAQRLSLSGRKRVEQNFSLTQMAERTIKLYEEACKSLKILVIKLSALGDVILIGPSLAALRKNFPQAQITVLVGKAHSSVLQGCPYINQILEFPLEGKGLRGVLGVSSLLRRLNFDIVVDLQNNRRSHWLSFLSACNRRYGYDNGKCSFLLNRKIKETKLKLSPIKHQERTLNLLGAGPLEENFQLWPKQEDEHWAQEFLKRHRKKKDRPLIGINLGASHSWPSKRWGVDKLAGLLDKIQHAGWESVITGKGRDKVSMKRLQQLGKADFIDALDKTSIMQLACLIKTCDVYVTGDSAPMHIAYAVKTPVVALFGPTDPQRHTIAGAKQAVIRKKLDCSACYKRRCHKHICMQEISPEEVLEAITRLL